MVISTDGLPTPPEVFCRVLIRQSFRFTAAAAICLATPQRGSSSGDGAG
jgi:hypothetical protein